MSPEVTSRIKSLLYGLGGAVLTYLAQWLSTSDFGPMWTPVVTGLGAFLVAQGWGLLNGSKVAPKSVIPEWVVVDDEHDPVRDAVLAEVMRLNTTGPGERVAVFARVEDDGSVKMTSEKIPEQTAGDLGVTGGSPLLPLVLFAVLLFPACAQAQVQTPPDLTFKLAGTTHGQVGTKVRLYVEFAKLPPGGDAPEVVVEHEAIRQSNPAAKLETETADNGRVLLIWAPAGSYDIRSRATLRSDATVKFESVYRLVMQESPVPNPLPPQPIPPEPTPGPDEEDGSSPQPEPKPGPAPEPPPPPKPDPIPVGEFGIAPKVAEIVCKIADPQRKQKQAELADAADALAAEIAAGTVTNVQDVLVRIGTKLKALGPEWSAAASQFSAALQLAFEQHKADLTYSVTGKITAPSAWSTLVRECGLGARRAQ